MLRPKHFTPLLLTALIAIAAGASVRAIPSGPKAVQPVANPFDQTHIEPGLIPSSDRPAQRLQIPAPYIATYEVYHSGARVGLTRVALTETNDGQFEMKSVTYPKGLAAFVQRTPVEEQSRFRWDDEGHLYTSHYSFSDGSKSGKRDSEIVFDWANGTASATYKGRHSDLALQGPMADRLTLQALLMRDLLNNKIPERYQFADRNEIKTYTFSLLGEEVLDTPAGRFTTVKILQQSEGSSRTTIFWAAKDHGYAMVKLTLFDANKPLTVLSLNTLGPPETPQEMLEPPAAESPDTPDSETTADADNAATQELNTGDTR